MAAGFLHHKVIIIDDRTVITGSLNFGDSASRNNSENILIVENAEIAKALPGRVPARVEARPATWAHGALQMPVSKSRAIFSTHCIATPQETGYAAARRAASSPARGGGFVRD